MAAAGYPGPWRQQAIPDRGCWEADALRDVVRDYVPETLADPDAGLVIDETGFLKQSKTSCGVGRQYIGSAGKITNCQIGVFATYASRRGHAFIDRALYLPLARRMVERAIAARVPFAWMAGDSVDGVGEIEMALRRASKGYVLGVNATQPFIAWIGKPVAAETAEQIARGLDPSAWKRLSAGEGTKGPRLYDWAYLELADLEADEYRNAATAFWTRGLPIRRSLAHGSCAYFTTWCPAQTTITTLAAVEGQRWAIEDAFETAKNELGLDHNETRSWHGWHRHVSLVMLNFALLAVIRHKENAPQPEKNPEQGSQATPDLVRWLIQEIWRVANRLAQRRIQPARIMA